MKAADHHPSTSPFGGQASPPHHAPVEGCTHWEGDSPPGKKRRLRALWSDAACGFILGVLLWLVAIRLGIQAVPAFRGHHGPPLAGVAGALLGISRARIALWIAAGFAVVTALVVGYTPAIVPEIRGLVRTDPLRPVEAVVVLASDIEKSGALTPAAQGRLLRGYEVLREGLARRMVLTRLLPPKPSYEPTVRGQMRRLGLDYPIHETGPVANTHDEALEVGRLARREGWSTVVLVTDASHSRRAAATFEKAGVRVLCSPCAPRNYDLTTLETPGERLFAFHDWVYEIVGWQVYRLRGWI